MTDITTNAPVVIYIADDAEVNKLATSYRNNDTKEGIVAKVMRIFNPIQKRRIIYKTLKGEERRGGAILDNFLGLNAKKKFYQMTKADAAYILAAFDSVAKNYELVLGSLPPGGEALALFIARHGVASKETAKRICGKNIIVAPKYSWSGEKDTLLPPYDVFTMWTDHESIDSYGYFRGYSSCSYIANPYPWLSLLSSKAFPVSDEPIEERVGAMGGNAFKVSNLKNVSQAVRTIQTMIKLGRIEPGATKLMTQSAWRLVDETIKLPPVYGKVFPKCCDRLVLEVLAICMLLDKRYYTAQSRMSKEQADADVADVIKSIFSKFRAIACEPQLASELLPSVSGITKGTLSATYLEKYILQLINLIFDGRGWKSLDDLDREICIKNSQCADLGLFRICGFAAFPWTDLADDKNITPENAREKLTFPFIRGFAHLLMSLGCAEIIAEPSTVDAPFSGIRFLRPTALGMYAAGVLPKPLIEENDAYVQQYELIDRPLLVVSKKEGNPYDGLLSKIAVRHGNRWIVTPASFMRECSSQEDIDAIVSDFKKYICQNPTQGWIDFFKKMSGNIGSGVCSAVGTSYIVYSINSDNKDLLEYIARTPGFAEIAIKAEGYKLVVRIKDKDRFIALLRRGGFVIN